MSDLYNNTGRGRKTAVAVTGAIIGIAVTGILICLFAAAILIFNLDRAYCVPFGTLSLSIGSFAAAYYVAKRIGNKGYLFGTLVGLITFAVVTAISLIINKNGLTVNTVFHLIIIVLSSALGGILAVNRRNNKKYI